MSPEADVASPIPAPGLWARLRRVLGRTEAELRQRLDAVFGGGRGDISEIADELEEGLLAADLGPAVSARLVDGLRRRFRARPAGGAEELRDALAEGVAAAFAGVPAPPPLAANRPAVVMLVGVNGVGKTTTIAKLARQDRAAGRSVVLVAGDTFRAAAAEQLALWAERLGAHLVRHRAGSDPAAVVFDGLQAARARSLDRVYVDTAGRLHTKSPLMAELAKVHRVVEREAADWQRRVWLVIDGTTGQNAMQQAREFARAVPVDGLIVSKLDGTAKGGALVALVEELRLPILFVGSGEGAEDLDPFDAPAFAAALVGAAAPPADAWNRPRTDATQGSLATHGQV